MNKKKTVGLIRIKTEQPVENFCFPNSMQIRINAIKKMAELSIIVKSEILAILKIGRHNDSQERIPASKRKTIKALRILLSVNTEKIIVNEKIKREIPEIIMI